MAYLILSDQQGEFDRRELTRAMVIGRAMDCEICVRDILLSRRHCCIEPFKDRWVVEDLGSKNGTRIGSEVITKHVLSDGDVVQIGKIQVSFQAGRFVPAPASPRRRDVRPVDPNEALSGTVLGFQLFDMEEDSRVSGFPIPKPKPAEPASLRQETVQSMVAQIASEAWDAPSPGKTAPAKSSLKPPPQIVKRNQQIARAKATVEAAVVTEVELAPAAAPVAVAESEPVDISSARAKSPEARSAIPTWLACIYLLLALTMGITSIAVVLFRSHL